MHFSRQFGAKKYRPFQGGMVWRLDACLQSCLKMQESFLHKVDPSSWDGHREVYREVPACGASCMH